MSVLTKKVQCRVKSGFDTNTQISRINYVVACEPKGGKSNMVVIVESLVVVQSLRTVSNFATPWTAAQSASCPSLSARVCSN